MNIGLNNFVNGGADEALLKSLAADERYQDNDELAKALKKEGLVQVQTTVNGRHGTYTRMQWKRASDVKSTDRVVGQQQPAGQDSQTQKPQYKNGTVAQDGTLHPAEGKDLRSLVEEVTGTSIDDLAEHYEPALSDDVGEAYNDVDTFDIDKMDITSARIKDKGTMEVKAHVKLTVYVDNPNADDEGEDYFLEKKDERDFTFTAPYKNKGASPHD